MAPIPLPVDPALGSWRPSDTASSPGLALDSLLQLSSRSSDRLSLPNQSNLDSSFTQELHLPAMKQNPTEPNPLWRFWTEPGPWDPQRIGGDQRQTITNPRVSAFDDPMRRNPHALYEYRSPRSEADSSTTGRHPLDSGYDGSRSLAATSARSVGPFDLGRSCQSISGPVRDFPMYSEDARQDSPTPHGPSPRPQYGSTDVPCDISQQNTVPFELACQYQNCEVISKNPSEHR